MSTQSFVLHSKEHLPMVQHILQETKHNMFCPFYSEIICVRSTEDAGLQCEAFCPLKSITENKTECRYASS